MDARSFAVVEYKVPDPSHTIDGRSSMRSIADAVEALRAAGRFFPHSLAQVWTGAIRLPNGTITSLVLVVAEAGEGERGCAVALPSSASFTGKRLGGALEEFEISRLDRALVDDSGTVELSDGIRLRAVNVVPTVICRDLTQLQKRIVYWTIKLVDAEERCYRQRDFVDGVELRYGPPSPDLSTLDYSKVYGLELPSLKEIAHYIAKQDPTLKNLSHKTIATALSNCGMRRPRSGRLAA
jgi:hypothetical protein